MGRTLYIEPVSGASGDMIVGALLGLGLDFPLFRRKLLSSIGKSVKAEISLLKVDRAGLAAGRFEVVAPESQHHRGLSDIRKIINAGTLPASVRKKAIKVFTRLAEAEAAVHGTNVDKIHFHEVGAVDSIIDVLGACLAFEMLAPDRIICGPLPLGSGTARTMHGSIPVPVPAVVKLLEGQPVIFGGAPCELTTPTGAALLAEFAVFGAEDVSGTLVSSSCGAGAADFKGRPNILRASMFECGKAGRVSDEEIAVLETNLDDMMPEYLSALLPALIGAGARDASIHHILMKKGRPGYMLQVIAMPGDVPRLAEKILAETSAIGVRFRRERRFVLERKQVRIRTSLGMLDAKIVRSRDGSISRVKPEYESCLALAEKAGLSYYAAYERLKAELAKL